MRVLANFPFSCRSEGQDSLGNAKYLLSLSARRCVEAGAEEREGRWSVGSSRTADVWCIYKSRNTGWFCC